METAKYEPEIRLCSQCKEHGYFTLPGAEYSLEFCSIEGAMKILQSPRICRILHPDEIEKVKTLISRCFLPQNDSEAMTTVILNVESWNEEYGSLLDDKIVLQYAAHNHYYRQKLAQKANR